MKRWVLCINQTAAIVYHWRTADKKLEEVARHLHPEGRLKNQDLDSDKPGRSFKSPSSSRSAFQARHTAVESDLQKFVKEVAESLELSAKQEEFEQLTIVAEPGMLGILGKELGTHTAKAFDQVVHNELSNLTPPELAERLLSLRALASPLG